ncbi:MAG: tyrosine-type recombinase/integrase [Desulfovibrio sp.]|nr:tyrosine-type recombinase/integrase [Desulfovibrio sp.]
MFAHALQDCSPATLDSYTRAVCDFLNFAEREFYAVSVAEIDDYVAHLHSSGRARASVRAAIGGIRAFFRRLHGYGLCPVNPALVVKAPKATQSESVSSIVMRSLSFAEVDRALAYLKEAGNLRNLTLFYFLSRLGLRASEACALRWRALAKRKGQWVVSIRGKGRKTRTVLLPEEGVEYMLGYRKERFQLEPDADMSEPYLDQPLFGHRYDPRRPIKRHALNAWLTSLYRRAGLRKLSPHDLRHTCFTHLCELRVPLEEIQAVAGHESIGTTSLYIKAGRVMSGGTAAFNRISR